MNCARIVPHMRRRKEERSWRPGNAGFGPSRFCKHGPHCMDVLFLGLANMLSSTLSVRRLLCRCLLAVWGVGMALSQLLSPTAPSDTAHLWRVLPTRPNRAFVFAYALLAVTLKEEGGRFRNLTRDVATCLE